MQRGPQQQCNQITSHTNYQSYAPPSAPAPFGNSHSSSFDDILSSQHPYDRHYGGYAGEEVPWFKEHKRRRTVGPTGLYGAGSDHYGSAGAMRGSPYSLQSQHQRGSELHSSPPGSNQQTRSTTPVAPPQALWSAFSTPSTASSSRNYSNNYSSNYYTPSTTGHGTDNFNRSGSCPPLWPSAAPAPSPHPVPAVSAPQHQNNYNNDISSAGILPNQQRGMDSAREPAAAHMTWPQREEGSVRNRDNEDRRAHRSTDTLDHHVQTERANSLVIDLYDTSDSDDSDTGHHPDHYHRRAQDTAAPAGAAFGPHAVANNKKAAGFRDRLQGGVKSHAELNTDRHKHSQDGQNHGKNLKDRFHTGLALLQQTQASALNDLD